MRIAGVVLIVIAGLSAGCYYDQEGILYPNSSNCTPASTPSFQSDVMPVLQQRCVSCHSGSFPSGNISLDTYEAVIVRVNDRSLMGSINQASGFSPMPKNSSKLTNCEIQNIQKWVDSGAGNN